MKRLLLARVDAGAADQRQELAPPSSVRHHTNDVEDGALVAHAHRAVDAGAARLRESTSRSVFAA